MILVLPALCGYSLLAVLVRLGVDVDGRRFPRLRAVPNRVFYLLGIVLYLMGVAVVKVVAGDVNPVYMDLPLLIASLVPWLVVFIPRRDPGMVAWQSTKKEVPST